VALSCSRTPPPKPAPTVINPRTETTDTKESAVPADTTPATQSNDQGFEDKPRYDLSVVSIDSLLLQCRDGEAYACRALSNRYATGAGVEKDEGKVLAFAQQARRLETRRTKPKTKKRKRDLPRVYDYSQAIRKIGPLRYEAGKADLTIVLSDLGHLQSGARIVPNMPTPSALAGFRFRNVQKDSFFEAIGLRHDDIVRGVNDEQIDDTRKISLLYRAFLEEEDVRLTVNRGGDLQTHYIRVVERPVSLIQKEIIDPENAPRATSFGRSKIDFKRWVVSSSDHRYEVTVPVSARKTVSEIPILEHGWLVAVHDANGFAGVRLAGILRGGVFDGLGLLPGDVIRAINGSHLSAKSGLDALPSLLLNVGVLQITVSRNAASISLQYTVRSYAPGAAGTVHSYDLSASRMKDILPDLPDDMFRPYFRKGVVEGMRITKPQKWLSYVFLQSSDVLVSLNETPITTPEQARTALQQLNQPGIARFVIQRQGSNIEVEYKVTAGEP